MKLLSYLSSSQKKRYTGGAVALLVALGILVADEYLSVSNDALLGRQASMRGMGRQLAVDLDDDDDRVDLGDGKCEWAEPMKVVPEDVDLWKTLLVGFPSGDKRMTYVQMEALSGLPSKDDWDFVFNGYSNAAFIKTNYPHPLGVWSWDAEANQVALVIQYIRRSLVEFSDIMWYMSFENDYNKDREKVEEMYGRRLDTDEFYKWRDQHVLREIYKYGWYIDYWMENGLYRDPYSHNIIDEDTFQLYRASAPSISDDVVHVCHRTSSATNPYILIEVTRDQLDLHLDHGDFVGHCDDAVKDPDFMSFSGQAPAPGQAVREPNCSKIEGTCRPIAVISADRLRDYADGPAENEIIGNVLTTNKMTGKYVIDKSNWSCMWDQIVNKNKGPVTFEDRNIEDDPNFSAFMLEEMASELQRLVDKYSDVPWIPNPQAQRIVELLSEHIPMLRTEIDNIKSGRRTLSVKDIYGPGEREALFGLTMPME
jgi:hypothetical protein